MKDNYDFSGGKRGAVVKTPNKRRITIRIDNKVLEWFKKQVEKESGGNYQSLMNKVLLEYVTRDGESVESLLRRVLREDREERNMQKSNRTSNKTHVPSKKPIDPHNHHAAAG